MKLDLFEKTEVCVRPVRLDGVDLTAAAKAVAEVIDTSIDYVQVIDARDDLLSFDITAPDLMPEQVFGKGRAVLQALSQLPGLEILPETDFHAAGILGMLSLSPEVGAETAKESSSISENILSALKKRVCVFPTGAEVISGQIIDTNSPYLKSLLENYGCKVTIEKPIPDNEMAVTAALCDALDRGYGMIITTGGVGAEAKDVNVDAVIRVSETAYTSPIVHFKAGEGRHLRDSVRIVVGVSGASTLITLPGPHAEVEACANDLISFVQGQVSQQELSARLAKTLRNRWSHAVTQKHHEK